MSTFTNRNVAEFGLIACLALASAPRAEAAVVPDFNLVVFGDLDTQSEVEGKVFVGGNMSGGATNVAISLSLPTDEAGLIVEGNITAANVNISAGGMKVGGDVAAGTTVNMNSAGNYTVDGSILGNVNNGSVGPVVGVPTLADMQAHYGSPSSQFAALTPNSTVSVDATQVLFAADPGVTDELAVFTVTAAEVFELPVTVSQLAVALNNSDGMIINVLGTDITVPSHLNSVGDLPTDAVRECLVWNFPEAETLNIEPNFNGAILAPNAALGNVTALDGQVIVDSFVQLGEVHLPISGKLPVPEPSTGALALLAIFVLARRPRLVAA